MRPAAALAERLGLPVRDLDLLQQALIHSSYLHEHRDLAAGHNERLEFLGDSVVSLAISDVLYRRHPDDDEGVLSARRASIVSTAGLARLAGRLGLGEYLLLGEGEAQRGGRLRPTLLASAFEALVGAIYLDLGYVAASDFVTALAAPEITSDRPLGALKSPKSRLQEYTQRLSGERPQYRLLDAVGPDHDKVFRIEVAVGGRVIGMGQGHSRRVAETEAAARAIETLRADPGDLAGGEAGAPELAEFGGSEADFEDDPSLRWQAGSADPREPELTDPLGPDPAARRKSDPAARRKSDPAARRKSDPAARRKSDPAARRKSEPWIEMDIGLLDLGPHSEPGEGAAEPADSPPAGEGPRS